MIIRQSRQVKHACAVLSAALLALALTIVPSTALADEPVENEQLVVVDEGQATPAEEQVVPAEEPAAPAEEPATPAVVQEDVGEAVVDGGDDTIDDSFVDSGEGEQVLDEQPAADVNENGPVVVEGEDVTDNGMAEPNEQDEEVDATAPLGEPGDPDGLDGNTYVIQMGVGGTTGSQVLDVKGGKVAKGSNVQTYAYNGSNAQKWDFKWITEYGAYVIGVHGTDFAYVLDLSGAKATKGSNVQIWTANGSAAQLWVVLNSSGAWNIAPYIDTTYVIDVASGKNANGTNVDIWTTNGTKAQSCYLRNTNPGVQSESEAEKGQWEGTYTVTSSKDSAYALDIKGASYDNNANLQIYRGNGTAAQRLHFEPDGEGYYIITVIGTGKVLDVAGGKLIPGANIQQYNSNGSDAQKWAVVDNGNDTVTIVNKGTGLVLDIADGTVANSANVQGYSSNDSAAQQFILTNTPIITDGIYEIRSRKSTGSVIDIANGSNTSGGLAQLWTDNDSLAQRYQVVTVGTNTYIIRTAASGGWLTGHSKSEQITQEGSSATQSSADVWKTVWNGSYFSLQNVNSGLVFDLKGGSVAKGTALQGYTANGSVAQHFFFVPADLIKPGLYEIHSGIDTKYNLDVNGGSASAGANIQIYTDNSTIAQMYTIEKSGNGYKLINAKSGLAVTGGSSSGTNVAQQTFTGASTQIWIPVIADGGFVVFQNAANTNVVLDVAGDTAANGKNVQVETTDGSSGQKWKLDPVKTGWYKINNHWQYISVDPRAHFDYDLDSTGKSLGHYDVLYRLWYRVNGYKSGSKKPYGSNTNYLIVSAWDDCYLGVFVGVGNPNSAGYWQPLYGWNCGNGNRNVINEDARKQAEREGRTTTWSWDPEWDYALALNNDTASRDNLPDNNQWARPLSSSNYRLLRIPNNNMERYFTSVRMTLGYHSTITSNPSSELGRHVSHGCIRLDVNNARTLYALMGTKGKTTKDLNGNVITYSNGQAIVGVGPGTRCIQLSSSKGSY